MQLEITKTDFERAVPAAREPKGKIFDVMQDAIMCKVEVIADSILGEPGIEAVENGTDDVAERLRFEVKTLACVSAFLEEMRGLDLVLTATGFGVVSTNDTAPASKMRVDALEGDLRRKEWLLRSELLTHLFKVEGWADTEQRHINVPTLFYRFHMLEQYAGISRPKPEDWSTNVPAMLAADSYLRKHIGYDYMEELLQQLTSRTLSGSNRPVAILCLQFIGAWIAQNHQLKQELYMRLINRLEADLSLYPKYADSEAYRLNHFKPYENHAEDSAFHFVG